MKKYILEYLLFLFTISTSAQGLSFTQPLPKREVRAVWITTIGGLDWPHNYSQSSRSKEKQQQELRDILDNLQKAGINTVLIQTRIRATTIYPSKYEPWDGCLSGFPGKSPGYDALEFAIKECHKRGMEIQAWIVTLPVGSWSGEGCKIMRGKYPGLIKLIDGHGYMNPEDPRTANIISNICEEITRNYDIDGIHLDYIRYPETWKMKVSHEEGRRYITSIVQAIHDKVKSLKPWVKISCSPIGKYNDLSRYWSHGWNAYEKVCQDAQGWLSEGLMDELFPMMYFQDDQFYPFAINWKECDYGKIVAPGLGIYFLSPKEKDWSQDVITREMHVLRQCGLGHAFFRSKFFTDNIKGIYDFSAYFDSSPALIPAMTWESASAPSAPTCIKKKDGILSWNGARIKNDSPTLLYNIYASKNYPVDINDSKNLLFMKYENTSINTNSDMYYAITAIDRYGNESNAIQSYGHKDLNATYEELLNCDNESVYFNINLRQIDAKQVIITSLSGNAIGIKAIENNSARIRNIKDGIYILHTINEKGITHRLGYFIIDRNRLLRNK